MACTKGDEIIGYNLETKPVEEDSTFHFGFTRRKLDENSKIENTFSIRATNITMA